MLRATALAALLAAALATAGCPPSTACSSSGDCHAGQACIVDAAGVGTCTTAPAGEGEAGEGEGAEGEGAEGEGAEGEGEGEGEGAEGEGEGEGAFTLDPGVFLSGASSTSSVSFALHGAFVTPSHPVVSTSSSFKLTSLR